MGLVREGWGFEVEKKKLVGWFVVEKGAFVRLDRREITEKEWETVKKEKEEEEEDEERVVVEEEEEEE
ncbi:hypothetical protein M0804_009818 [Polistes exclamans]|nr:hypothetical protein M0804_009818 [Polistes exclamans]